MELPLFEGNAGKISLRQSHPLNHLYSLGNYQTAEHRERTHRTRITKHHPAVAC